MNTFYLNIGNTHTEFSCSEDCSDIIQLDTGRLLESGGLLPIPDTCQEWQGIIACVVPAAREALTARYGSRVHFISVDDFPEIDFSGYSCQTLGADRIANAAGAWHQCKGPVMVVDCGTAINTEIIDATGKFLGGAIMQGRAMELRALHALTAQLPPLPVSRSVPENAIGNSTAAALQAGVNCGCIGAIRELCRRFHAMHGFENGTILAVGGDSPFFLNNMAELQATEEHFTLKSLKFAKFAQN